jgi:dCMP deaminase
MEMTLVRIKMSEIGTPRDWDEYFMNMAEFVASKSKDRSGKIGTVLVGEGNTVLTTGYNGFPRGVDDENEEYHKRPEKYFWTEHSERNAIYNAARNGIKLYGAHAYSTAHPCVDCARAFVQAGIKEITIPTKHQDPFYKMGRWPDWEESFTKAREVLGAGGIKVRIYAV